MNDAPPVLPPGDSGTETDTPALMVLGIVGIGTDKDDAIGFVKLVAQGGAPCAVAFDVDMAEHLATAFMHAAAHLRQKQAMRLPADSTLIPGQPVVITSGKAEPVTVGPDRQTLLTLTTEQHLDLRFVMKPRVAEAIAKRLTKKGTAGSPPPKSAMN